MHKHYISPLFEGKIFKTRAIGKTVPIFNCGNRFLELISEFKKDFYFDPKKINKIKNRKFRKRTYQSFALYKKSFKPRSKPKLKTYLYKWKTDDRADAMLYAYYSLLGLTRQDFEKQYLCSWDLAAEDSKNAG